MADVSGEIPRLPIPIKILQRNSKSEKTQKEMLSYLLPDRRKIIAPNIKQIMPLTNKKNDIDG